MALSKDAFSQQGQLTASDATLLEMNTNGPDRVIIAVIGSEKNSGSYVEVLSISDDEGLTWTRRSQHQFQLTTGSSCKCCVEVWWAPAPLQITTDDVLITLSQNTDDTAICLFSVVGADLADPFDGNASLPKEVHDVSGSSTTAQATGVSTDETDAFVYGVEFNPEGTVKTSPSGYTQISQIENADGSNFAYMNVAYKVISSALAGATIAWVGNDRNWGVTIDALKEAGGPLELAASITDEDGISLAQLDLIQLRATISDDAGISTAEIFIGVALSADLTDDARMGATPDESIYTAPPVQCVVIINS